MITGFAQTQPTRDLPNPHRDILLRIDQSNVLPLIHGKIFQLGMEISVVLFPLIVIIFGIARKVESERQQVMATKTKYREIFENAHERIFQSTPTGQILSANPAMANILGYESPHALIRSLSDLMQQLYVDPNQRQNLLQILKAEGSIDNFEFEFLRRDGTNHWGSRNIRAAQEDSRTIRYIEGTIEDIAERKEAINRLSHLQTP